MLSMSCCLSVLFLLGFALVCLCDLFVIGFRVRLSKLVGFHVLLMRPFLRAVVQLDLTNQSELRADCVQTSRTVLEARGLTGGGLVMLLCSYDAETFVLRV